MTTEVLSREMGFRDYSRIESRFGRKSFPNRCARCRQEYSSQKFPADPIVFVAGDDLPGFDGALFKAPIGKKGWAIIYNNRIQSTGRINFTLGHELGHYLCTAWRTLTA